MDAAESGEQLVALLELARLWFGGFFWWGYTLFAATALLFMLGSGVLIGGLLHRVETTELDEPRWRLSDCLLSWFMWLLLSAGLASVIHALLADASDATRMQASVFCQVLVNVACSVFVLVFLRVTHQQGLRALGLDTCALWKSTVLSPALFILFLPGCYAVLGLWTSGLALSGRGVLPQESVVRFAEACQVGDGPQVALFAVMGILAAPMFEELLYRGLLTRWLLKSLTPFIGILLSGVIFGLVHGNLQALVPLTVMGMVLAWIYRQTGNLWICILFHMLFNSSQFGLLVLQYWGTAR